MLKIDFGSGYNPNKEYKTCDITGSPILNYLYDKKDTILNLKEKSVDEFYLRNVVHHIPDLKRTFKCLKKYLKNGGKIKIIEWNKSILLFFGFLIMSLIKRVYDLYFSVYIIVNFYFL